MKKAFYIAALVALGLGIVVGITACANDAQVASHNLSQAADNFEIPRRIVFYNGITDTYILQIEGMCSLDNGRTGKNAVAVTCKTGPGQYKKHFLSQSDNVTWFAEQMDPAAASTQRYRVTFKPSVIVPSIDVR